MEHITILKSTGLLPYFMIHGVEPLFSFDLTEATFLVPVPNTDPVSGSSLITWRAQQLQKYWKDINTIYEQVLLSWFASLLQFEMQFKNQIRDFNFNPSDLILVWCKNNKSLLDDGAREFIPEDSVDGQSVWKVCGDLP